MDEISDILRSISNKSSTRLEFWAQFINYVQSARILEIGVWKGEFSAYVLAKCGSINDYHMLDPWRKLPSWNKPLNVDDSTFEHAFREAMANTEFAAEKRAVLRGTTVEMIDRVPNDSLDFVYIDGDHTLRGISIDLINSYSKLKPGGYLAGDDLSSTIWQHGRQFEPTLVFPFAVYFAEASGCRFFALPFSQFVMIKPEGGRRYSFTDFTGKYRDTELRKQLQSTRSVKERLKYFVLKFMRRVGAAGLH